LPFQAFLQLSTVPLYSFVGAYTANPSGHLKLPRSYILDNWLKPLEARDPGPLKRKKARWL
jgi:hypothetical protein